MFDWNDLRFFLEVSRRGRLVTAARHLAVDHTTVSRRIQALEERMNTKLFDRTPAGYSLTPAGAQLVEYAEAMETTAFAIQESIAGQDLHLSGTVRLGAPEGFASAFLGARLHRFFAAHPGIQIDLVAAPRYLSLSKREADLAIGLARPTSGRLVARKLTDYRLCLYAAPAYLERMGTPRSLKDLETHDFIGYVDDLIFAPELRYLDKLVRTPQVVMRSTSLIVQRDAAIDGLGLCILPCFVAATSPGLVPVIPKESSITRSFWLVTHADLRDIVRVRTVADYLRDLVKRDHDLLIGKSLDRIDAHALTAAATSA